MANALDQLDKEFDDLMQSQRAVDIVELLGDFNVIPQTMLNILRWAFAAGFNAGLKNAR